MEELQNRVSAEKGYPADLVRRAAAARAQASGQSVEAVLAKWAGVESAAVAAPAAAETPPPAAAPVEPAEAAPEPSGPKVEVLAPEGPPPVSTEPEAEVEDEEVVRVGGFPRWLAAAFFVIPIIALVYAMNVPNGPDCGRAGQLAVDPVSGEAANCDGSAYGVDVVNFFSLGQQLYASNCASCHGAEGGGGTGPGFTGGAVLVAFNAGNCAGHVEWVAIGSNAWPEPTYGDSGTPVGSSGAVMPGFSNVLSSDELAAVVLYERVAFGGEALPDAEADCGLADEATVAAP